MLKLKYTVHLFSLMIATFSLLTPLPFNVYDHPGRVRAQLGCPTDGPPPPSEAETLSPEVGGVSEPYRQQAYIKASNTNAGDSFGGAVAVSGNLIVVGAPEEDSKAKGVNGVQGDNSLSNAGAAYVYVQSANIWSQQAYLKASAPDADDHFGTAIAISDYTIVVGAPEEDSNATGINGNYYNDAAPDSGAVYVFTRSGGFWTQQAFIKASNAQAGDHFGKSVSISGDTLLVGAPDEDSNATGTAGGNQSDNSALDAGAVYVFTRNGDTWSQQAYIKASNTDSKDAFGTSAAISGNSIVVGAPIEASNTTSINGNQNDNSLNAAGAAYTFIRNGNTWSQQAYIKASNIIHSDVFFGNSVAISGNTIVVGAPLYPDTDLQMGSAYVFTRSGGVWSQQAQLDAAARDCYDAFGASVGISGNTVIVGAWGEDEPKTGVNPDDLYPGENSGAAYAFVRENNNDWNQRAYIKQSNTGTDDRFGSAVGISGNILVVGAYKEDSNATGINGNQADNSMETAGAAYVFARIPAVYTSKLVGASPTTANTVDFEVTFSDPSTGVDVSDFKATASSQLQGGSVLGVSGGPSVYTVSVSTGTGNGSIRLDVLDDDSIRNANNVPLGGFGVNNGNFTKGEFYVVRPVTKVFRSQAAQDGWILETSETSWLGGTIDAAGNLIIGDDAENRQYRSIVSFDTSSLPDTAVFLSGTFKLRKKSVVGTPFATLDSIPIDFRNSGFFGSAPGLAPHDFKGLDCGGASPAYQVVGGVWYEFALGSQELSCIKSSWAVTQIRFGFSIDDDNDEIADTVSFYSGDAATASYRPVLVLEYYEQ